MIEYVKQKLEQGYYIAEHGRFQSSTGRRGAIIGGISLMTKEGLVDYEIHPNILSELIDKMDLVGLEWGNTYGFAGGIEYRTKEWHDKEISNVQ